MQKVMTRTDSFAVAALVAALATVVQAQRRRRRRPEPLQANLRHQIYLMEGALARAVNFGAASLNQEIRAVMPDMMVLAGESTARGFHLDGYGVFFDVEVPVLRQSMMWSLRTHARPGSAGRDRGVDRHCAVSWRRPTAPSGPRPKRPCAGSKRRSGRSDGAPRQRAGVVAAAPGRRPAIPPGAARPKVDPQLLNDPNKAYTDAVVKALIDAMVDYSLPMVSSMQAGEYLTVAARDNERRDLLAPPNPYEEVSTFMLRIRGSDLAEDPGRQDRPRRGPQARPGAGVLTPEQRLAARG